MQMTIAHLMDDRGRTTDRDERRFNRLDRIGPRRPLPRPVGKPLRKGQRLMLMMKRYERGEQIFHPSEMALAMLSESIDDAVKAAKELGK